MSFLREFSEFLVLDLVAVCILLGLGIKTNTLPPSVKDFLAWCGDNALFLGILAIISFVAIGAFAQSNKNSHSLHRAAKKWGKKRKRVWD